MLKASFKGKQEGKKKKPKPKKRSDIFEFATSLGRYILIGSKCDIVAKIYLIRGQNVMIDSDLSELYQVETKRLNERVKRNKGRFPEDFMFELTKQEWENLKSQNATSNKWGGRRTLPGRRN